MTFTRDKQLVCRHAQDDLHTTTDILLTPLAARCKQPFRPARFDAQGALLAPAAAECRTSDITLAEFRTLRGKRDGFEPRARTVEDYVWGGKAAPDPLGPGTGLLLSHAESIALFRQLGVQMVPELKQPVVTMPYDGSLMRLRKLHEDYDPTDRIAALSQMLAMQALGEIATGLLYVEPQAVDLHAALQTVATPLNRLGEAELCPGAQTLAQINAGLR